MRGDRFALCAARVVPSAASLPSATAAAAIVHRPRLPVLPLQWAWAMLHLTGLEQTCTPSSQMGVSAAQALSHSLAPGCCQC